MGQSHLSWVVASVAMLLAVCHVSANPAKHISKEPYEKSTDECPLQIQVDKWNSPVFVPLRDNLEFRLRPNLPELCMIIKGKDVLYKATVDGTMVIVYQCDMNGLRCEKKDEGGYKSSDFVVKEHWNMIMVNNNNSEITVDVNSREKLLGYMSMNGGGEVAFQVPDTTPHYTAQVEVLCPEYDEPKKTPAPRITAPTPPAVTTTTTNAPISPAVTRPVSRPFEHCPLYVVESDHPSIPALLHDRFTLAVYPTHSTLQLIIGNKRTYLKVYVDGSTAMLQQCNAMSQQCSKVNEGIIDGDFIAPKKWNYVTFYLNEDEISIEINERKKVLVGSLLSVADQKGVTVIAMAPQKQFVSDGEHYVAYINIMCEGGEHITLQPTPISTLKGEPSNAPIVDTTPEPPTKGVSRNVGIAVGVLVGVLLIIALAIIISTALKKRRSAGITEQSPLQSQQYQQ